MLVAATVIFLYYTVWTLIMVSKHPPLPLSPLSLGECQD